MASTRSAARCVVLGCLIAFMECPAFADELATITGRITDPPGLVVAGVKIDATNINTNITYSGESNADGLYRIPSIPPGAYRVIVQKTGFARIVKPGVDLHVQDIVTLNFTMQLGSISQTITVEGGAPLVNTESAAVNTVIDRKFVESLPLNGRSFNTLLQLTPGVVIAPQSGTGLAAGQFSIAGQRSNTNNFMIDGVSANFGIGPGGGVGQTGTGGAQAFSALGGTSSLVSVEALREFRVETSSFAPEFGKTPGGQVILNTRSGTNDFHGGVYEYFRNDALDANDWFANQAAQPRAAERHNDFGGFLGGPIWKNKTFFFVSYEGARLRLPQTSVINVPSQFARSSASSGIAPFLNAFPIPNGPASPSGYTARFTGTFSNRATLNATSLRVDHTFNSRISIFGRYNDAPSDLTKRVLSLSMLNPTTLNTRTLTLGVTMPLSPRVANATRGNYSTQYSTLSGRLDSFGGAVPPPPNLLLGSLSPADNGAGFRTLDTGFYRFGPLGRNRTGQASFVDDLSVTEGPHQLKVGGDYRAILLDRDLANNAVVYTAPSVTNLVTTGRARLSVSSVHPSKFLAQSLSLYAQDVWRATSRLTLTYGVRWELAPAPSARGNTVIASWMNTSDPAQVALAPTGTPAWNTTHGNVAPRIGIAYSLNEKATLVLRAGGGVFYDLGTGAFADLAIDFPNVVSSFFPSVSLPISDLSPFLPAPASLQPPYPNAVTGYSSNLKLPRSYQWNVSLEKALGPKQAITATYVGQAGRDLTRNAALFRPNANFRGDFLFTDNSAWSNYHSFQAQYRRSLVNRLQALLSYTWSHSLDNASNDVIAGFSNTVISAANDYASSGFDVRHSFSSALTYDIPGIAKYRPVSLLTRKWSISTVIVARSGFPFNAIVFSASPDPSGIASSRPDLVPGQPLFLSGSQCLAVLGPPCPGGRGLNPAAFVIPATPRQGSEGRNHIPGFGLTQVDLSLSRKLPISEHVNLEFRADTFNAFNHPNFMNPDGFIEFGPSGFKSPSMLNQGLGGLNSLFQEGGPRSLQLSLKITF
jgi:hypothetical protein